MSVAMKCYRCGCTDDNACLDPETKLPCSWVNEAEVLLCSVCAKALRCDNPDCGICRDRGVVPDEAGAA